NKIPNKALEIKPQIVIWSFHSEERGTPTTRQVPMEHQYLKLRVSRTGDSENTTQTKFTAPIYPCLLCFCYILLYIGSWPNWKLKNEVFNVAQQLEQTRTEIEDLRLMVGEEKQPE
ncbi:predicted protein, partial [Arabidopsis lyrata subsp. lyrata]